MPRSIAYFPSNDSVTKDQLINIRNLYNDFNFNSAFDATLELNLSNHPETQTLLTAWLAKAHYR
jgi:hypothetical protein